MKIFTGRDIKPSPSSRKGDRDEYSTPETSEDTTALPLSTNVFATFILYAVTGGCAGFVIRGMLHMAGFKEWMFTRFSSFVSLGDVLNSVEGNWGRFSLLMLAFVCTLCSVSLAVGRFLGAEGGRDNG